MERVSAAECASPVLQNALILTFMCCALSALLQSPLESALRGNGGGGVPHFWVLAGLRPQLSTEL